jgi:DNA replication protein DnaC
VNNGISAIFVVVPDLLSQIRDSFNSNQCSELSILRGLLECELLVLDDIGSEHHKGKEDWAYEKLYQIINARYNHEKATIFTTNCSLQELDDKLSFRTFSRIIEMSDNLIFDMNDFKNWRMKNYMG